MDAVDNRSLILQHRRFRGYQTQHHLLAISHILQRLETTRTLIVILQIEGIYILMSKKIRSHGIVGTLGGIVDLMVKELSNRLADQELSLELTDAARTQVIENGYDPVYGARPLKRYLQNYVETLAAKKILSGDVHAGDTLVLDVKDGEFVINTK